MPARSSELAARLYADLIGKPFVDHGRGPNAFDCLGIVIEVQGRIGNEIRGYLSDVQTLAASSDQWEPTQEPRPGDVVLFRSHNPRWHVGIVLDSDRFLHARPETGVVIERFASALWRNRVEGFYAWKSN